MDIAFNPEGILGIPTDPYYRMASADSESLNEGRTTVIHSTAATKLHTLKPCVIVEF